MSTQVPPASRVDAPSHMVWVDCEMTGLEPPGDVILEVACLITDADLKVVDQTEIVVHRSEEVLQNMNEWCVEHHNASGLTDRVRASSVSIEEADRRLHQFVAKYVKPKTAPMVGNSVYMDRLFIMRELPLFNNHLHYRIIDVSSLKELCKMYNPELYKKLPPKRLKHRGLEDIQDTLEEFKFYKRHFLHTAASLVEFPSAVPYC
ncbi:hypothetical protein M8J76_006782 [Diaphorina citri]|nr:hypothetical protein M8J75_011655 [Diaphorina citri]KAI5713863.1 hypothetical protein M8J76_006782 [Diaphorina citri]